jgi:malate dehydrogenase
VDVALHLQPVSLVLLDIEAMMGVLKGVVMEMTDCALPLLKGLKCALLFQHVKHVK